CDRDADWTLSHGVLRRVDGASRLRADARDREDAPESAEERYRIRHVLSRRAPSLSEGAHMPPAGAGATPGSCRAGAQPEAGVLSGSCVQHVTRHTPRITVYR